jgi:hypothetical protein
MPRLCPEYLRASSGTAENVVKDNVPWDKNESLVKKT